MPWAAGSFSRLNGDTGWVDDASLGIGIEAGEHDLVDTDFKNGINQCLNKDGSNAATGNLNLGGFRYTNAGLATARTELARVDQIQDGDFIWLGTTGGTATAMTANASPAITAYKNGQKFRMKPNTASTGQVWTSHTLNVNGVGAAAIIEQDGQSPTVGSWLTGSGRTLELVYNDGFFVIVGAPRYWSAITPTITPGAGTATGVSFGFAKFMRVQNSIAIQIQGYWTQGVASCTFVDVSLPVRPSGQLQSFSCAITGGATIEAGYAYVNSLLGSGSARLALYNNGNILTGSKQLFLAGMYEIG